MLVGEDMMTSELVRLHVLDAAVSMGEVSMGARSVAVSPDRLLAHVKLVEDSLLTETSRNPSLFRYLPRRAYSDLMAPPILSDLCKGVQSDITRSWLCDQFIVKPLARLRGARLPRNMRESNARRVREWAFTSIHSPRFYVAQDLRWGLNDEPGWVCVLATKDIRDLLAGPHRHGILEYASRGIPLFVEIEHGSEAEIVLEWMTQLKLAGLGAARVVLSPIDHEACLSDLCRLLELPQIMVTTSGASVESLETEIQVLKNSRRQDWASGLVFASNYPELKTREDTPASILEFLMSKRLSAEPGDLQKILGGNILSRLPIVPPLHRIRLSRECVTAEGALARTALTEFLQMVHLLSSLRKQNPVSLGFMLSPDGSRVDTDMVVIVMKEYYSNVGSITLLEYRKEGALRIAGWSESLARAIRQRASEPAHTMIGAACMSGTQLESPAHLPIFRQSVLKVLRVDGPEEVLAASQFRVELAESALGLQINPHDLSAIGAREHDLLTIIDPASGSWGIIQAQTTEDIENKRVRLPDKFARMVGLGNASSIEILRFNAEILEPERITLVYSLPDCVSIGEVSALVYLHQDEILAELRDIMVGKGTRLHPVPREPALELRLYDSDIEITQASVAVLRSAAVSLRPVQATLDVNVIVCIMLTPKMNKQDCRIRSRRRVTRALNEVVSGLDLEDVLGMSDGPMTRRQLAIVTALYLLWLFSSNRSDAKIGFIVASGTPQKFSIQKGNTVQFYAEFCNDLSQREVIMSAVLMLADCMAQPDDSDSAEHGKRLISEMLEDFGPERPTAIFVIGDSSCVTQDYVRELLNDGHSRNALGILRLDKDPSESAHIEASPRVRQRYIGQLSVQGLEDIVLTLIDEIGSGTRDF